MKIPGPDHPITITATPGHVTVTVDGTEVASTDAALSLAEADYPVVQYVPLTDVHRDLLGPSDTVTTCPYKGDASYYSITIDGTTHPDAIWHYATPHHAVAEIAETVAFDPRFATVRVEARSDSTD